RQLEFADIGVLRLRRALGIGRRGIGRRQIARQELEMLAYGLAVLVVLGDGCARPNGRAQSQRADNSIDFAHLCLLFGPRCRRGTRQPSIVNLPRSGRDRARNLAMARLRSLVCVSVLTALLCGVATMSAEA